MLKQIIKRIKLQLIILLLLFIFYSLSSSGYIMSTSELRVYLMDLFKLYGTPLIAICALIENIVGINIFFPGSVVILTGMAISSGNPKLAIITWFVIIIPSFIGQNINYLFGRYFSSKDRSSNSKIDSQTNTLSLVIIFFTTLWHPHFASVTTTACGSEKVLYRRFIISLLSVGTFWYLFWGILMYNIGHLEGVQRNFTLLFIGYTILWATWDVLKLFRAKQ